MKKAIVQRLVAIQTAILTDAAGGVIVVKAEHLQRANEGSVENYKDKRTGNMIYKRVFE